MSQLQLSVTTEEKDYLVQHLRQALDAKRVEVHRTEARAFREAVEREVGMIESLLTKLTAAS